MKVRVLRIDTDWYEDDRQKVYDYIIDRFGTEKTGYVLAMGTLADKSVIDMLGKAFRMREQKLGIPTIYTLDKIKEIKAEYDKNPQATKAEYSDLFYYYDGLCGCIVSQSQHPAGIIASPINLIDFCGAFLGENGQQILPLDMDCCHDSGLVKYDILGLKTVGVIDKTCKLIGRKYPKVHEIDFYDEKVYQDMSNDHTSIFQFESDFAGESLKKMNCKSVFDMSLVNASIRPSGESYRDKLLNRIPNHNPSEIIDKLLENNYGWLIYQEDTIAFLQQICGFSGSDADNVRRAIGRKKVDELNKALPKILDGYCSKSDKPRKIAEEEAKAFLKVIEDASSYQFGYNHSIAYSIMSYLCGYFRYYYPVEYCTSFLNCAKNDEDTSNGTILAKIKGCKIENPLFRKSTNEYGCDATTKTIYKGLGSIKDIGKNTGGLLYELKDNVYETFYDLLLDIKEKRIANKTEMNILINIGYFKEFGDTNKLLIQYNLFMSKFGKNTLKKTELDNLYISSDKVICEKETEKQFSKVDIMKTLKLNIDNIKYNNTTETDILSHELKYLGYTNTIIKDIKYYGVEGIETNKYGSCFIKLYNISNGESQTFKVKKSWFNDYPCEQGDILDCIIKEQYRKTKDENGKWVDNTNMPKEKVLTMYSKVC